MRPAVHLGVLPDRRDVAAYDPSSPTIYILDAWLARAGADEKRAVMLHEMTHAAQHQNHPRRFMTWLGDGLVPGTRKHRRLKALPDPARAKLLARYRGLAE